MMKNNSLFKKENNEPETVLNVAIDHSGLKLNSEKEFSCTLYDIQSKLVRVENTFSNYHSIDTHDLNAGVYILKVNTTDGQQFSRRIPVLNR